MTNKNIFLGILAITLIVETSVVDIYAQSSTVPVELRGTWVAVEDRNSGSSFTFTANSVTFRDSMGSFTITNPKFDAVTHNNLPASTRSMVNGFPSGYEVSGRVSTSTGYYTDLPNRSFYVFLNPAKNRIAELKSPAHTYQKQ